MPLLSLKILPLLGLKNDVPEDDSSLFQYVSQNVALTHDVGGLNVDYQRTKNCCTKSLGYSAWSNSAIVVPARGHLLFELDDGVNRDNLLFEKGRVYYYDGTPDPVRVTQPYVNYDNLAGGAFAVGDTITGQTGGTTANITANTGTILYLTTPTGGDGGFDNNEQIKNNGVTADCVGTDSTVSFESDEGGIYSAIQFGSYIVFADGTDAGNGIFKWANGDTTLSPLITTVAATMYKCRYLEEWQRRIIIAYTNATNGDLEIRWCAALPTWTALSFESANQLYKPTTDSITGISKMGANALFLYGTDSIGRVTYYANVTLPFGILTAVEGQGCTGQASIVNARGANWFFNKNYGFVRYLGGSRIVSEDIISKNIEEDIAGIDSRYYGRIVGKFIPHSEEIVWAIPLAAATTPTHLLYYNLGTGQWRKEDKACRVLDVWTRTAGQYRKPVFVNADGHTYQITGETLPSTGNLDGYRVEPVMDFGNSKRFKVLHEIWFGIVEGGDYSIDLYHRSGDTVKELLATAWGSAAGTLNLNNPARPWININKSARYHQIKWGTNLDSEKFAINWIEFRYSMQSEN